MADKRRDSGEYYPGGRVIARPGTAPQQVVVQWSDVQNKPQVAPLPERYRDSDVKTKINEIASKFATVVVAALIGWSAVAGLVVQKAQKDQLWNDELVVTNVIMTGENASGAARILPKYLWLADFDDSYPDAAAEYYRSRGDGKVDGGCSAVRDGGFLYRNFDFPFDDRAEFIVRMSAGKDRFASVGVAQVGTNLTEQIVTSGKPSRCYKWLPGATVDGINEHGVVAEINVVDGPVTNGWHTDGDIHPLGAVRWALDNGTSAGMVASNLATRIKFPSGWAQNFHWLVADERETWVVEDGSPYPYEAFRQVMTNFKLAQEHVSGEGAERFWLLKDESHVEETQISITNAWYTNAYRRETDPAWVSDLEDVISYTNEIFDAWATHPKEYFRGRKINGETWWQTVHTSIYDITNRTLRISVQEVDDWYTFAVSATGGVKVETDPTVPDWAKQATPPEGMTENALVWTNNAVRTKDGTKTMGAEDVGALPLSGGTLTGTLRGTDIILSGSINAQSGLVAANNLLAKQGLELGTASHVDGNALLEKVGVNYGVQLRQGPIRVGGKKLLEFPRKTITSLTNSVVEILATTEDIPTQFGWQSVTNAPSTLAGYGIADAYSKTEVDTALASKANLMGGNIFYGDQWIANGDLNLVMAGFYVDRTGVGNEYIYGRWNGDTFSFEGTKPFLFLNEVFFSTAYGNRPYIDNSPIATEDDVERMIDQSVSANLNTYVDGQTGVEYVGKMYDGNLYYVPTGNVIPPNN